MALLEQEFIKFRNNILRTSLEVKSNTLVYFSGWFFEFLLVLNLILHY